MEQHIYIRCIYILDAVSCNSTVMPLPLCTADEVVGASPQGISTFIISHKADIKVLFHCLLITSSFSFQVSWARPREAWSGVSKAEVPV